MTFFNLQLFADANMNYSYSGNGTSGHAYTVNGHLSPEMKEFYSKDLIELAQANLVHQQFAEKASIPRNGGRIIEWRMFSPFPKATTPLTEGVTPAGTPIVVKKINKQLEEFGAYSTVTDLLDLTAIDNVIVETTSLHAQAMGKTLDTIVRNEMVAGAGNWLIAGDKTLANITSSQKITVADIAKAVTTLKKNNAPKINGSYVGIVHPSVSHDLMQDPTWIDIHKYKDPENIYNGEIGTLYGVRFVETTEALITQAGASGSEFALYHCLIMGKGATKAIDVAGSGAEIIVKEKGSSGTEDPLNQRSTIGWKIPMFGAQVVIPEYIVDLVCASTFSPVDATAYNVSGDTTVKTLSQRIPSGKSNPITSADVYTNTAGD